MRNSLFTSSKKAYKYYTLRDFDRMQIFETAKFQFECKNRQFC